MKAPASKIKGPQPAHLLRRFAEESFVARGRFRDILDTDQQVGQRIRAVCVIHVARQPKVLWCMTCENLQAALREGSGLDPCHREFHQGFGTIHHHLSAQVDGVLHIDSGVAQSGSGSRHVCMG